MPRSPAPPPRPPACAACAISVVADRTLAAPSRIDLLADAERADVIGQLQQTEETVWLFCTSISAVAVICCRSPLRIPIWSRMPRTVSLARSTFAEASRARLRMSLDTTANPRPDSPARAASTDPLTASMLVCTATRAMVSMIFSILRPTPSTRRSRSRRLACRSGRSIPLRRGSRWSVAPSLSAASRFVTRSSPALALACDSRALRSI